jgi:hypothetical protein
MWQGKFGQGGPDRAPAGFKSLTILVDKGEYAITWTGSMDLLANLLAEPADYGRVVSVSPSPFALEFVGSFVHISASKEPPSKVGVTRVLWEDDNFAVATHLR